MTGIHCKLRKVNSAKCSVPLTQRLILAYRVECVRKYAMDNRRQDKRVMVQCDLWLQPLNQHTVNRNYGRGDQRTGDAHPRARGYAPT